MVVAVPAHHVEGVVVDDEFNHLVLFFDQDAETPRLVVRLQRARAPADSTT
jgi:hypothetical protein